ncbi:DNA repair protein RecN [Heliophilum fasciatum]|uniref:DNA repair protein RecN n=1 Tax=Heliophilum fasciatum TaxID=35700 RepID=A0A4R2S7H3_9FIRM|nr:DNA repair protein RecN [Heliophilum fasciatum]MCW2277348.1 DNA repair protein RecN (Recombination protein N) [Heliophilum fasciatum]TCP67185.1 DNA replication and repair protein RecN [Heliophilum fasciatum]
MLARLRVENFALIEEAELELTDGLNLITGETGAGKSLLIDAVGLLIGGRATPDVVRSGAAKARVEGFFRISLPSLIQELTELGLEIDEGELLLTREVAAGGKSACRINGRTVPGGFFRDVGSRLIDLQGQHEQQSLMNSRKHRLLLDRLAGSDGEAALATVAEAYRTLSQVEAELGRLQGDERERIQRQDLLMYQIKEIDEAALVPGEEEELLAERKRLQNMEKLLRQTEEAYALLSGDMGGGVLAALGRARTALVEAASYDEALAPVATNLEAAYYQVEDVTERVRDYREEWDGSSGRLDEVEERLDLLRRLKRKYGASVDELLLYRRQAAMELETLSSSEERCTALLAELEKYRALYDQAADKLSLLRQAVAEKLASGIGAELAFLGMKHARLHVQLTKRSEPALHGAEEVEFLFSPNLGEPPKPLAKIASGGELARVLLAFKVLLAQVEGIPSLVFDEIDTGVGGQALQAVAQKMGEVSRNVQVLCVTHSPQIAAYGDLHFKIYKLVQGERTRTQIEPLPESERIKELARMLGGDLVTDLTYRHADEMYRRARVMIGAWA